MGHSKAMLGQGLPQPGLREVVDMATAIAMVLAALDVALVDAVDVEEDEKGPEEYVVRHGDDVGAVVLEDAAYFAEYPGQIEEMFERLGHDDDVRVAGRQPSAG